jgi:aromatic ring-opening dioxygenase catalytic subunit (LigB family)
MDTLPTLYICHGGGPWPYLGPDWMNGTHARLAAALRDLPGTLPRQPEALLVISAHWEAPAFTVQTGAAPPMLYDYFGFPPETYTVRYDAPGSPVLAARAQALLAGAGIATAADAARGFDHGAFVPLSVMYPQADIPVAQLSLLAGLDPAAHLAAGRALAPLRDEGVLIIGSGLSYHNLRRFGPGARAPSTAFDDWLWASLQREPAARTAAIIDWEHAPCARDCHPREEHLLPLMVALGAAAQGRAERNFHDPDFFGGAHVSGFRFD